MSFCDPRSRPAISCTVVGSGPRCSPWLKAVSADVAVSWVGKVGSGVPWSFCFLVRVRGDGATDVREGGIPPDGDVGGDCLDSWGVGEWSD